MVLNIECSWKMFPLENSKFSRSSIFISQRRILVIQHSDVGGKNAEVQEFPTYSRCCHMSHFLKELSKKTSPLTNNIFSPSTCSWISLNLYETLKTILMDSKNVSKLWWAACYWEGLAMKKCSIFFPFFFLLKYANQLISTDWTLSLTLFFVKRSCRE